MNKYELSQSERKRPGMACNRRYLRERASSWALRHVARGRARDFIKSIPKSGVLGQGASRLSVNERAHYQRVGMWPPEVA